jgi:hypothetical protein
LLEEALRKNRRRARQRDRVVCIVAIAARAVVLDDLGIAKSGASELRPCLRHEPGVDFHAQDGVRATREQRGEISAASADLEHAVARAEVQLLQHAGFHLGRPHSRAVRQRYLEVGECDLAVRVRHELLAPDREQQVQNVLVEHVPRADLLLHHVEPGLLDIECAHRNVLPRKSGGRL